MKFVVGFSRAKSAWAIGSKSIQIAEKRPYSHTYVRYESKLTGVQIVAQASHGFVNEQNFEIFKQKNIVVKEREFEVDIEKFKLFRKFIDENLGKPYSRIQIIFLTIKKLFRIELDANNKDDAFICSEFIARVLEVIGVLNTSNEDSITPSDLEKLINKL